MEVKSLIKSDSLKTDKKNLVQRIEKIASALYLVTSVMIDEEPVKWQIRKNVVTSIGLVNKGQTEELVSTLEDTNYLLYLASRTNLISTMNLGIVESYIKDTIYIFEGSNNLKEHFDFKEEIEEKGQDFIKDKKTNKDVLYKKLNIKRTSGRKEKRREMVVMALKKKKESSIKDISKEVKGCSEKTIQREVNDLIAEGKVSKSGERRWSKYSLIDF